MIQILVGLIQTSLHQSNLVIKAMLTTPFKSVLLRTKLKPPQWPGTPLFWIHALLQPSVSFTAVSSTPSFSSTACEMLLARKRKCPKWINGDSAGKCSAHQKIRPLCWASSICELCSPYTSSVTEFAARGAHHYLAHTLCLVAQNTKAPGLPGCFLSQVFQSLTAKKVRGGSWAGLLRL